MDPSPWRKRLGSATERICPRCRAPALVDAKDEVVRCKHDGYALVLREVLESNDGDPFIGLTIADRFVVLGKLGAGSMGNVYLARQQAMGRDVAVKILRSDRLFDAQSRSRFEQEARAMSFLTSPHTVTVFDFGEIPNPSNEDGFDAGVSLYLAMEMLPGESLGARLKREGRVPMRDAIRFARHALLSLAEAHDKGIVHRDLKPDNLFLVGSSQGDVTCKLLDFGIAKVITDSSARVDAMETQAGTVFGTPRYMSPEQAQGKPLDARSDLYALGVLLYQMVVGSPPFVDDDAVVVMARHIKSPPIPPKLAKGGEQVPDALSDLIMRALSKSPDDRPASAREFESALAQIDEQLASSAALGTGSMSALVKDDIHGPLSARVPLVLRLAAVLTVLLVIGAFGASLFLGTRAVSRHGLQGVRAQSSMGGLTSWTRTAMTAPGVNAVRENVLAKDSGAGASAESVTSKPMGPVGEPAASASHFPPPTPRKVAPKTKAPRKSYTRFD